MASDMATFFSTDEADECFMNEFVLASSFLLEGDVSQASELYEGVGMNWAVAEKKLAALEGPAAHEPTDDSSLVEDVRFAVEHTLEQLWAQHTPKVKGKNLSARRVPLKMPAIVAAYSKQVLKIDVAAKKQQARESPGMEGTTGGSFLDKLAARLDGSSQETQVPDAEKPPTGSGKGQGLPQRAPEVSSLLQHAAARLMNPGPPPLRQAERWGAMIAQHILQEKSSITDWVDRENLTGHNGREARTIARAVELGVSEYGAGYLASKSAEVQLRRLLAICVAAKSGSTAKAWRAASLLEELPSDGIGGILPSVVNKALREQLKLELQIESMLEGKMPEKGEKPK